LLSVTVFAESVSVFAENDSVYARRCLVELNSLKILNLTNAYPNNKKSKKSKNNKKVKSKPLQLYELTGKKIMSLQPIVIHINDKRQ
jgi:hypothetical protein